MTTAAKINLSETYRAFWQIHSYQKKEPKFQNVVVEVYMGILPNVDKDYLLEKLLEKHQNVPPVDEGMWQSLVIEEERPVIVEFWAPWCGPCRMIDPVIGELAVQYAGKLKFYKLNTDESPKIATRYGIRSIPTVMIFRGGEKKEAIIGAVPKITLSSSIEKFLP